MTKVEQASAVWEAELASGASEADAAAAADAVICGTYEQYKELRAGQNVCPVCGGKGWIQTTHHHGRKARDKMSTEQTHKEATDMANRLQWARELLIEGIRGMGDQGAKARLTEYAAKLQSQEQMLREGIAALRKDELS